VTRVRPPAAGAAAGVADGVAGSGKARATRITRMVRRFDAR
jgi:hypothetical protein